VQLLLYAAPAAPLAVPVVLARPEALWYPPAYAALFAANASYAARRWERALVNDLASVLQSCLIVLAVATFAGSVTSAALATFLWCLAYFAGTVCYLKTMLRERDSVSYRRCVRTTAVNRVRAHRYGPSIAEMTINPMGDCSPFHRVVAENGSERPEWFFTM
jgi:hypothetical protein